jgi:hypothetical protein
MMSKKIVLVLLIVVIPSAVVGFTAFANQASKWVEINQDIAGSIFAGIEVTTDPINGVTQNRTMLNLYAKGAPGAANLEVVGGAIPAASSSGLCPTGTDLEFTFVDTGIVETFNDHSLLFYVIDESPDAKNALCVDFEGPAVGFFDYVITGGAGRFQGATGNATVEVTSWFVTNELTAEIGTIRGTVQLP